MTNYLRPDEKLSESNIRKAQDRNKDIKSVLQTGASLGTTAIAGQTASKILPFLSEYIPEDLAFKGINKVVPKLGDFLKSGMSQGLTLKSGLEFLKGQMKNKEIQTENTIEDKNIIQKYSPELFSFIDQKIRKGESPLNAGSLAQNEKQFQGIIKKLTEDYRTPFSNIIETVFGKEMGRQKALKNFNDRLKKKNGFVEQETDRFNQYYGDQQRQQGQVGPGQQALMDILNNINQRLGQ